MLAPPSRVAGILGAEVVDGGRFLYPSDVEIRWLPAHVVVEEPPEETTPDSTAVWSVWPSKARVASNPNSLKNASARPRAAPGASRLTREASMNRRAWESLSGALLASRRSAKAAPSVSLARALAVRRAWLNFTDGDPP